VRAVALSPDLRLLAAGGEDRKVRLWSIMPLRLARLPAGLLGGSDLEWAEGALREEGLSAETRGALEFVAALIRWRYRHDVQLGEGSRQLAAGAFDIEVSG
jgi:hypothetical protein